MAEVTIYAGAIPDVIDACRRRRRELDGSIKRARASLEAGGTIQHGVLDAHYASRDRLSIGIEALEAALSAVPVASRRAMLHELRIEHRAELGNHYEAACTCGWRSTPTVNTTGAAILGQDHKDSQEGGEGE